MQINFSVWTPAHKSVYFIARRGRRANDPHNGIHRNFKISREVYICYGSLFISGYRFEALYHGYQRYPLENYCWVSQEWNEVFSSNYMIDCLP